MTQWILSSSLLIAAVLLIRKLAGDKLSARVRYALWGLVLLRLLIPVSIGESALSVQNWMPDGEDIQQIQMTPAERWEQREQIRNLEEQVRNSEQIASKPAVNSEAAQTNPTSEAIQWMESNDGNTSNEPTVQIEPVRTASEYLLMVWGVGMVLVAAVFLLSNLRFALRLHRSRVLVDRQVLPIYVTAAVESPCMYGLLRPAVYVTPAVWADKTAQQYVLAHELTHYLHGDHVWSFLRCLAVILHWYNPLVWTASFASQLDGELACDEGALKKLGDGERTGYARTLLDMTCVGYKGVLTAATSMTGSESDLKTRVLRIVKNPKMTVTALIAVLVIAVLAAVMLFSGAEQNDTLNGVWRSEVVTNDLGSEYSPYVFEMYVQYEMNDGEGRRTVFRDGEVEQSVHFTYTVRGDVLTLSVEEPPFWNPDFVLYKETLQIRDGCLIEDEGTEDAAVYFPCEIQDPTFLPDELFNVNYIQSWDLGGLERRAAFEYDSYTAALLYLFRQAEVTVLEGAGRETLKNPGYFWVLNGTNLQIADGVVYDDENGYLLSNIKEIEQFLTMMPWEFTEPETDGVGMTYYNRMQEGVINIKLTLSHDYREQRYYVPGNQSQWRAAIQEVYDNAVTEWPDSFTGETLYENTCPGFRILGGEKWIYVYQGGIFGFNVSAEHPDGYTYQEYFFATPEQAPKLTALMEHLLKLYDDSYAMGIQNETDYSGTWLLESSVPALGITDMMMFLDVGYDDQEVYSIRYKSRFMAKQNGELIKSNMEVGVTGENFLMRFQDGTEYEIPHTLQGDVLTLNVNGTELRFRRGTVQLEDYLNMGDLVLVPRQNGQYYDAIVMEDEEKEAFVDLIIKGLAAKEETENIIVSNKSFYYLPVMAEALGAEQVILSDLGTIHFQGEAYRLTNWEEIKAYLDTLDLRYTKPMDLYPKG